MIIVKLDDLKVSIQDLTRSSSKGISSLRTWRSTTFTPPRASSDTAVVVMRFLNMISQMCLFVLKSTSSTIGFSISLPYAILRWIWETTASNFSRKKSPKDGVEITFTKLLRKWELPSFHILFLQVIIPYFKLRWGELQNRLMQGDFHHHTDPNLAHGVLASRVF